MSENLMDRERDLIWEVQRVLPGFVKACANKSAAFVLIQQDAFAPMLGNDEIILLGKAIKYAGLMDKEVRIIPSKRVVS